MDGTRKRRARARGEICPMRRRQAMRWRLMGEKATESARRPRPLEWKPSPVARPRGGGTQVGLVFPRARRGGGQPTGASPAISGSASWSWTRGPALRGYASLRSASWVAAARVDSYSPTAFTDAAGGYRDLRLLSSYDSKSATQQQRSTSSVPRGAATCLPA